MYAETKVNSTVIECLALPFSGVNFGFSSLKYENLLLFVFPDGHTQVIGMVSGNDLSKTCLFISLCALPGVGASSLKQWVMAWFRT
jgi:hypothetical protein